MIMIMQHFITFSPPPALFLSFMFLFHVNLFENCSWRKNMTEYYFVL